MFGPRDVLLTSEEPVVKQFLNGRREGPIGMSEEQDAGQVAAELASLANDGPPPPGTRPKGASGSSAPPQIQPSPGLPERQAANRRRQRVLEMMHTLPGPAQQAIQKPDRFRERGQPGRRFERPAEPWRFRTPAAGVRDPGLTGREGTSRRGSFPAALLLGVLHVIGRRTGRGVGEFLLRGFALRMCGCLARFRGVLVDLVGDFLAVVQS